MFLFRCIATLLTIDLTVKRVEVWFYVTNLTGMRECRLSISLLKRTELPLFCNVCLQIDEVGVHSQRLSIT